MSGSNDWEKGFGNPSSPPASWDGIAGSEQRKAQDAMAEASYNRSKTIGAGGGSDHAISGLFAAAMAVWAWFHFGTWSAFGVALVVAFLIGKAIGRFFDSALGYRIERALYVVSGVAIISLVAWLYFGDNAGYRTVDFVHHVVSGESSEEWAYRRRMYEQTDPTKHKFTPAVAHAAPGK